MHRRTILELYVWTEGTCFRCARWRAAVTLLDRINTPAGVTYNISACPECVLALESERERLAHRAGRAYEPGQLGRRG